MQKEIQTIGHDDQGTEFVVQGDDVYRMDTGRWISKLTPFLTLGVKRYGVTLIEDQPQQDQPASATKFQEIDADQRMVEVTDNFVEIRWGGINWQRFDYSELLNVRKGQDQNGSWVELKIKLQQPTARRDSYAVGIDFRSTADAQRFYDAVIPLIEWAQVKAAPTKQDSAYNVMIGQVLYGTYETHEEALDVAEPLRIHHTRKVTVTPV